MYTIAYTHDFLPEVYMQIFSFVKKWICHTPQLFPSGIDLGRSRRDLGIALKGPEIYPGSPMFRTLVLITVSIFTIIPIPVGVASQEFRKDKLFVRKVWGAAIFWLFGLISTTLFHSCSIVLNFDG